MIGSQFRRIKLQASDWLRTGSFIGWRAALHFMASRPTASLSNKLLASSNYLMQCPHGMISTWALKSAKREALAVQNSLSNQEEILLHRSMVIKPFVAPNEPGAILISFEKELGQILNLKQFAELQNNYRILFMPSWQNFFSPESLRLDVAATAPYYLLPSAFSEDRLQPMLGEHGRFLPFHAASWVNHHFFAGSATKDIDLLMLANFSSYKRHWRLFQGLRDMDANLKVRLIGKPLMDSDLDRVKAEAKAFGVENRIEILPNVDDQTLLNSLHRARLLCAMSHREGSYIAVPEAIMANTPVAMFSNAIIGTKAYINEETGFLLNPAKPLGPQLTKALEGSNQLSPREWACQNISAEMNCVKLNEMLKEQYEKDGLAWTQDVKPFYSKRFDFFHQDHLTDEEAGTAKDYLRLEQDFGLKIHRPALES